MKVRMATDNSGVRPHLLSDGLARKRQMAISAAGIFAGAALLNLVEATIPSGPPISLLPGLLALAFAIALWVFGPRLPIGAFACLGPAGAAMIAVAVTTTEGPGDG